MCLLLNYPAIKTLRGFISLSTSSNTVFLTISTPQKKMINIAPSAPSCKPMATIASEINNVATSTFNFSPPIPIKNSISPPAKAPMSMDTTLAPLLPKAANGAPADSALPKSATVSIILVEVKISSIKTTLEPLFPVLVTPKIPTKTIKNSSKN